MNPLLPLCLVLSLAPLRAAEMAAPYLVPALAETSTATASCTSTSTATITCSVTPSASATAVVPPSPSLTATATVTPEPLAVAKPNPYRAGKGALVIVFPPSRTARLSILRTSGELLRGVRVTKPQAGQGRAQWDGRDSGGRVVAPGTYAFSVETEAETFRGKVTVTK